MPRRTAGGRKQFLAGVNHHPEKTARNLSRWCFPNTQVMFVHDVEDFGGANTREMINTDKTEVMKSPLSRLQIVSSSGWEKLDVSTYTFYSDVYDHPGRNYPDTLSIERRPIVQRRSPFLGRDLNLCCVLERVPCITPDRNTVAIPCAERDFARRKVTLSTRSVGAADVDER